MKGLPNIFHGTCADSTGEFDGRGNALNVACVPLQNLLAMDYAEGKPKLTRELIWVSQVFSIGDVLCAS